jgi:hypothetical protein
MSAPIAKPRIALLMQYLFYLQLANRSGSGPL